MTASTPLPRNSRFLAEWLFLLAALLVLGSYIGYFVKSRLFINTLDE